MKKKLTVTVDEELIPRAKRHARRQGVSLSSIIEASLRRITEGTPDGFAERWRGRFEPVRADDERSRALSEKYL